MDEVSEMIRKAQRHKGTKAQRHKVNDSAFGRGFFISVGVAHSAKIKNLTDYKE